MWIAEKYFELKLSKNRIEKYIRKLPPFIKSDFPSKNMVSAVQRTITPVSKIESYIEMINGFVLEAALKGSSLVSFPEYNFFDILGIIPGFKSLNSRLADNLFSAKKEDESSFYNLFLSAADPIRNAVETIMCLLAERYGIYIYTGSFFIKENGRLYSGGSLISREGKILGTQKKLHLTDFEVTLGIDRGRVIEIFDTDIGRVACPICMDATYFETFRLLSCRGCDIAVLPIANNEEYNPYKSMRGAYLRTLESYMYVVKPSLNGYLGGIKFTGKAGIFAPLEITPGRNGIINISDNFEGNNLISSEVDLDKLYEARKNAEYFGDRNEEFEKDYFSKTYLA